MGKRKQAESRPVVVNSSSTSPPQYVQLDLNSLYKAQNIYLHDFVGLVFSSALGNVLTEWTRGAKRELHLISINFSQMQRYLEQIYSIGAPSLYLGIILLSCILERD